MSAVARLGRVRHPREVDATIQTTDATTGHRGWIVRHRQLNRVLYWSMIAAGAVAVAPALVVPALFEYAAKASAVRQAAQAKADLQATLERLEAQAETLANDPTYRERLERQEFGRTPPGVTPVPVATASEPETVSTSVVAAADVADADFLWLAGWFETQLVRYPIATIWINDATRPTVLLLGLMLIAAAVLLLGRPPQPRVSSTQQAEHDAGQP